MNDFFDNIEDISVGGNKVCVDKTYRWVLCLNIRKSFINETFHSISVYEKMLDLSLKSVVLKDSDIFYKISTKEYHQMFAEYTVRIIFGGIFGSVKDVIKFIDATNIFKSSSKIRYSYSFSEFGENQTISGTSHIGRLFNIYTWSNISTELLHTELINIKNICSLCLDSNDVSVTECAYIMNCMHESWITMCRDYCMSIFTKVPEQYLIQNSECQWQSFETYHGGNYFFIKNAEAKMKIVNVLSKARKMSRNGIRKLLNENTEGLKKAIGVFNIQSMTQNGQKCSTSNERHFLVYDKTDPEFHSIDFIEEFIKQSDMLSEKTYRDIPFINKVWINGDDVILICCVGALYRKEIDASYIGYIGLKGSVNEVVETLKSLFVI